MKSVSVSTLFIVSNRKLHSNYVTEFIFYELLSAVLILFFSLTVPGLFCSMWNLSVVAYEIFIVACELKRPQDVIA